MSTRNPRIFVVAGLAFAALCILALPSSAAQAPTGTYVATTGDSAVKGSAAATGGRAGGSTMVDTSGGKVTVNLSSYSPQSEIDALKAIENVESFLKQLSNYNHGSVSVGGRSFPINFAASGQQGSNYEIFLLSTTPLVTSQTGPSGRSATGAGGGYMYLNVPTTGDAGGFGRMYSTVQVTIAANGGITARAGGSTATQLTDAHKQ